MELTLEIKNVRNIKDAKVTLPLTKGIYALVGENGCGKSTLMLLISLIVKTSSAHMLTKVDIDESSSVDITTDEGHDHWFYKKGKLTTGKFKTVKAKRSTRNTHSALVVKSHWPGFYEGSIFYGCRFDDFDTVDTFLERPDFRNDLVKADPFVSETLGYILHNNKGHYKTLYKIKNRATAEKYGFKGIPYFVEYGSNIISQFKMSSGECLLISLIDFINNLVIQGGRFNKFLFLIDEVELALHPGAIDRLVLFVNELIATSTYELVFYFSTHSAELIHRVSPRNIFLVENTAGVIDLVNPCYPNYAIRNLYIPNGFDFVLLVEDELAKGIVHKTIRENNLATSKLCCVLPAGGCTQMLKLHHDMVTYNTLGTGKHIVSIYDGDAKDTISKKKEYASLPKCFLPIPSVEKYLKKKCIDEPDKAFIKLIGDKYFNQRSLQDIIYDYLNDERTAKTKDNDGKNFYKIILSNLEKIDITESDFVKYICDDIYDYEKPTKFVDTLRQLLS